MKLGVFAAVFNHLPLEEMLDRVKGMGLDTVEIGCGYYPKVVHVDHEKLLSGDKALREFKEQFDRRGISISAISAHGNPLHPDPAIADVSHERWRAAAELAPKLGVDVVNAFSGCPGDHDGAKYVNWVNNAWPIDMQHILEWQWEEKVIPYWKREAAFAAEKGLRKIGFEMHPGMVIYNNATLYRLRNAVGPAIGCNYDPSHMFWQQIDVFASIRQLLRDDAIFHFHAKDTDFNDDNLRLNGVLEQKPYDRMGERAFSFRTIGFGHDAAFWKKVFSELQLGGYRGAVSIEHEDRLMSAEEGLAKAIEFLRPCVIASVETYNITEAKK